MNTNISRFKFLKYIDMKVILFLIVSLLLCNCNKVNSCNLSDEPGQPSTEEPDVTGEYSHPNLFLKEGEEKVLIEKIKSNQYLNRIHDRILVEAQNILLLEENDRVLVGKRLLDVSRENLRRIFILSYCYRTTGDVRFLVKAEREMLKAASFSDWNPAHFLDVAEMTLALSIGYDWLYNDLSEESRSKILNAIVEKGIKPSLEPDNYSSFIDKTNNWNQVCNGAMCVAAIAVKDEFSDLSKQIIDRSIESIKKPMEQYAPDGAFPEGYSYWEYGTTYNVLMISALETAFNDDYGLTDMPGFLESSEYILHMTTPTLDAYNYSDSGKEFSLSPAVFWFYDKTLNESVLYPQVQKLASSESDELQPLMNNRFCPALLLWGCDADFSTDNIPDETQWKGDGVNPVCAIRSSWDKDASYLAVKLGSPKVSHGHMDVGSFIFYSGGVEWCSDLGYEEYTKIENAGVDLWNLSQNSERWNLFRYGNSGHNTLTFDGSHQLVTGKGEFISDFESNSIKADITSVYSDKVSKAHRTFTMNNKNVTIMDEIVPKSSTNVTWQIITSATPNKSGDEVTLTKNGKTIKLSCNGVSWNSKPATPDNNYESQNNGYYVVYFTKQISTETNISVEIECTD